MILVCVLFSRVLVARAGVSVLPELLKVLISSQPENLLALANNNSSTVITRFDFVSL